MSNLDKSIATSKSAITAMRFHLDNRLVPVIIRYKEKAVRIGSGTCLKIKDRYFIITAGHVISENEEKYKSILLAGAGRPPQHVTNFKNIGYVVDEANGIDIGYIELSKGESEKLGKIFIEPNVFKSNINHLKEDATLVCGYPGEVIKRKQTADKNIYTVRAIHFQTITMPPNKWPKRFSIENHILLEYPKMVEDRNGNSVKIPDAPGISGGGIWALNAKIKGIWSPEVTNLIGIQSLWNPKKRFLVGIQIQHWTNLINSIYQELHINC